MYRNHVVSDRVILNLFIWPTLILLIAFPWISLALV